MQQTTREIGSSDYLYPRPQMAIDLITFLYAAIISAGGITGYVKKGSVASLVAGLLSGILMMFGSIQIGQDVTNVTLSLVTSGILAVVMGYRFTKSGKIVPAGAVTALSLLMVLRLAYNALTH